MYSVRFFFIAHSHPYLYRMKTEHHPIDQMGQPLFLKNVPSRIISLVPSQSELLHHLALDDQVIGITKFCIYPPHWRKEKNIIGGTKNFNFERIDQLNPDLIIGNKEENYPEGIARLKKRYPVWMSDVSDFEDALGMIRSIGELTNRQGVSGKLIQDIKNGFKALGKPEKPQRVLYFIWKDPWMVAGANTFIDTMLAKIGLQNCASLYSRYPEIEEEAIAELNPDIIFLSSEPFPFTDKHIHRLALQFPATKIFLVNGTFFSWYGSRLKEAPKYFKKLMKQVIQ